MQVGEEGAEERVLELGGLVGSETKYGKRREAERSCLSKWAIA